MSGNCCPSTSTHDAADPNFRKALWFALIINASMFVVEIFASELSNSMALKADALDFFGDSANYAISLFVVGSSLATRAKASIIKAATMAGFGIFVLLSALYKAIYGGVPTAETMGIIGFLALVANTLVAIVLYKFRTGDSNMRSVWLCSRNDAIGNVAVILAAAAVYISVSRWPDLIVATIIASLAISSAWEILKQARHELRH